MVVPALVMAGTPGYKPAGQTDTLDVPAARPVDIPDVPAAMPVDIPDVPAAMQSDIPDATGYFPGLRIGVNVSRPIWTFAEPAKFGLEAVADFNMGPEYFVVAESGFSIRDLNEPDYQLKERGMFLRFGADRNFYKQFNDVVGVGARLGFALFTRGAPFISVEPGYWGDYKGSLPEETFFRQWFEVVLVLKTEIFSNVFMGWNLRGKLLLFDKGDKYMSERYIPGFGTGTVNSAAGFDFYIYYRIPVSNDRGRR